MKRLLFVLALALGSFSVYFFAVAPLPPAPSTANAQLHDAGIAWVDGNASAAFFVLNASHRMSLHVAVVDHRIPERVLIWSDSDQARFGVFSDELQRLLRSQSIAVKRAESRDLNANEPAVLVVVGSAIPSELVKDDAIIRLLEAGWVVVYSGFPFSMMRSGGRIVANPDWPQQREVLQHGIIRPVLSIEHASIDSDVGWEPDRWQVAPRGTGFLAVSDGLLDASTYDAGQAASFFADFIAKARWMTPVIAFDANVSGSQAVISPTFTGLARQALVFTADGTNWTRRVVSLQAPAIRIIHPLEQAVNRSLSLSLLSNLSDAAVFTLAIFNGSALLQRHAIGPLPSGVSWHSHSFNTSLLPGEYVLAVSGSHGQRAHSVLRVFSYQVHVERVDPHAKTVWARLLAGSRPVGHATLTWQKQEVHTDSEGVFRLQGVPTAGGVNQARIEVDGEPVFWQYALDSGFLSSWTDRLLLAGTLGLFGIAWFWKRRQPACIHLIDSGAIAIQRVPVSGRTLAEMMEAPAHIPGGRIRSPLTVREFLAAACRKLADPSRVIPAELATRFLSAAAASGHVHFRDGLVAPTSWYASESEAAEAFFVKRLRDILTLGGWSFKRKGRSFDCRKGRSKMVLVADSKTSCVSRLGTKRKWPLHELERHLAA